MSTLLSLLLILSVVTYTTSAVKQSVITDKFNEATDFARVSLTDTNTDAVCNDGTPATYFYRAGSGAGSSVWTIYLEGGGWCTDAASCTDRLKQTPHYFTSKMLPQVLTDDTRSPDVNHGGINSGNETVNPHFYNANQIYLWYCSSDIYAGNYTNEDGFHFKGKVIIQTLIEDVTRRYAKQFASATHLLLLGFSAGALGAMHNADFVGGMVKSISPSITYKTYIDSGWLFDTPFYNTPGSFRDSMIVQYSNFKMQYNENCMEIYAKSNEQWRCAFPIYAYPHVDTSLFFTGYHYDFPFLSVDRPNNATDLEYDSFMRKTFLTETSPLKALFAPNCWCHGVVAYNERWNRITVAGTTASDSVWSWFTTSTYQRSIDSCVAIDCNPTCSCVFNNGEASFN